MSSLFPVQFAILIPMLPLIGAAVCGFFGVKYLKTRSHWPIWIGVGASAVLSIMLLIGTLGVTHRTGNVPTQGGAPTTAAGQVSGAGEAARRTAVAAASTTVTMFTWLEAGTPGQKGYFKVDWGYFFDPLTAVMLCVVCGIGFLITVFAAGYMKGESGYFRFFAYLGLFIFMMTNLVMGENLLMLYLGWEGVGLCSYLLIGYYYKRPSAREAAKKAFLVNRVGDFGFAIGIMLIYTAFGTVSFFGDGFGSSNPGFLELALNPQGAWQHTAMAWAPFLLMLGAFGKSAQFPLHVWLPDAMEGPTPVSALIHAATMVTAGIYMIARCGTMFVGNQPAMITISVVGGFTAIFAATIALRQFDLKKVFAYSTVSQLGFMFVGVGTLAPVAGVFHLVTHAFFKALLFLGSGVIMHAMMGELDMRKFSGLKRHLPKTRVLMLIGCLALAGFPFLSGFFSKDEILASAFEHNVPLGLIMLLTAFLTAYYAFRLYFRVFEGPEVLPHGKVHHDDDDDDAEEQAEHDQGRAHNHEPVVMIAPLIVLAIGAVLAGYFNWPGHSLGEFLSHSPSVSLAYEKAVRTYPAGTVSSTPFGIAEASTEAAHNSHSFHTILMIVSGAVSIGGVALAYLLHLKDRPRADRLAAGVPRLRRLLEHKYWIDELYAKAIVKPLHAAGDIFYAFDRWIVEGVVSAISLVPQVSGFALKLTTQRGYLQGYAASMLFGAAVILLVVFW